MPRQHAMDKVTAMVDCAPTKAEIAPVDPSLWTANEVRILRDLAKHHASLAMLAYHIGRTETDIAEKAASINLAIVPGIASARPLRRRIT